MLAYTASREVQGQRQSSPHAMLIVIAAHIALVAVVMSARMDLPKRIPRPPIIVDLLPEPTPPPSNRAVKTPPPKPTEIPVDQPPTNVPLPHFKGVPVDPGPAIDPGPITGPGTVITPEPPTPPVAVLLRRDPKLLTPPSELRPPYPHSKILSEEEATLRLRLTISESGRVLSVDPVGAADREFLDTARRYLIAHWRYQPATEDGRAITSSTVITLRFQLDG